MTDPVPALSKRQFRKTDDGWVVHERFHDPTLYPNLKTALMYVSARNLFSSSCEMGRAHNIEPSVPFQSTSPDVYVANYTCPRCSQPMTGLGLYCTACLDPDAEIRRLRTEVERLQRLIGEAYAKRGPDSSQVLRSLFGQATRPA